MNSIRLGRALAAATLACALMPALAHAQSGGGGATLRVVHGIPGRDVAATLDPQLPVDVLVNGQLCVLKGFTFGSVSDPLSVPAGRYNVKISLANTVSPCSNAPVIDQSVTVTAGEEAAVVAALSHAGAPVAEAFALDLSPVPAGKGRVIVAHAAEAPPVAVSIDGVRAIKDLRPGTAAGATLRAGSYTVAVFPSGKPDPVIGPVALPLEARAATLVFAVGSAASGTIRLIVRSIPAVI